ncbi:isoleucine--tRNA ligase [Candidatus Saccharibacteria bacterium]|nr:isoleucine--tRNA ligase [Candidatus Saccharibacteria bacterium]
MKYQHGKRRKAAEYEKALIDWWKKHNTFEQSVQQRPADNAYVFYDGPPFITGVPHHGTLLSSIVKDCVPRYQTMRGKRVERRWGWDCHGLPAENFVEKQLGILDRRQIGATKPIEDKEGRELPPISLEKYITEARNSMVANSAAWKGTIDRIGRWVEFDNAYRTMDKDFMESVWWAFKTLYDKGLIYEGKKVLMYDTKFATPVSKNEVTMDNDAYQTVTDPSVYVKFRLTAASAQAVCSARRGGGAEGGALKDASTEHRNDSTTQCMPNVCLLAWTTTPWTLPANTAAAVNPKLDYAEVQLAETKGILIVATDLVETIFKDLDYKVLHDKIKGSELVGLEYEPLPISPVLSTSVVYRVHAADYVEASAGTGIVHLAPIFGEEDFILAEKHGIPTLDVLDDNGFYLPEVAKQLEKIGVRPTDGDQIEVWSANKFIAKCLEEQGSVWRIEYIQHEYPFNPRSKQRLMYRAIPSWFMDIQGQKANLLKYNENINWFPPHLKHGRFAKNIEAAPDWNLSRDRFWATPMPVWKGDQGTVKVIGSYAELAELTKSKDNPKGIRLDDYHRPWVDDITFTDPKTGEHFTRIEKVLDCWFESGSMPFAQMHYPFENKEKFEQNYPASFIVEYIGQVRAWFYYVHVINTALFGQEAYTNVITTGVVAGNDGRKMSKSLGNFTDPNELMDKFSADALRFLLLSSPLLSGEDFALQDKDVSDVQRKLAMVWNMYDFFTMYAEVDGWELKGERARLKELKNPLDLWVISRLHQLKSDITRNMDAYNIPDAMSPIIPFLDDASNWFVRRSRRRFWKTEDDSDKNDAYTTLYTVLEQLALVLAPFTPFLAEELWQSLVGQGSVHLQDWPGGVNVDQAVLDQMATTRAIIEQGLAQRNEAKIKVRQPLSSLSFGGERLPEFYLDIIADEMNVKSADWDSDLEPGKVEIDTEITPALKAEGDVRELIRAVQAARKNAGLQVDDRIKLSITGYDLDSLEGDLKNILTAETLATTLDTDNYSHDEITQINKKPVTISLEKA